MHDRSGKEALKKGVGGLASVLLAKGPFHFSLSILSRFSPFSPFRPPFFFFLFGPFFLQSPLPLDACSAVLVLVEFDSSSFLSSLYSYRKREESHVGRGEL